MFRNPLSGGKGDMWTLLGFILLGGAIGYTIKEVMELKRRLSTSNETKPLLSELPSRERLYRQLNRRHLLRLSISPDIMRSVVLYGITSLRESVATLPLAFSLKSHHRKVRLIVPLSSALWGIWYSWGLIDQVDLSESETVGLAISLRRNLSKEFIAHFSEVPSDLKLLICREDTPPSKRFKGLIYRIPQDYPYGELIDDLTEALTGRRWSGALPFKFREMVDKFAGDMFRTLGTGDYVVLAPHSKRPHRNLSKGVISKVTWELVRNGLNVLLLGSKEDRQKAPINEFKGLWDLRGATNLGVAFSLAVNARLIIATDNFYRQVADVFSIPLVTVEELAGDVSYMRPIRTPRVSVITPLLLHGIQHEDEEYLLIEDGLANTIVEEALKLLH